MTLALCVPVTADDSEPQVYTPTETFSREELLAMDPELDSDGDGLADVYEIIFETNRFNPDTDFDGVSDYVELCITCTDVLVPDGDIDTDGDGLTNAQEGICGTNADDKDSDNDNLSDYDEFFVLKTDPLSKNSDSASPFSEQSIDSVGSSASPLAYTGPDIVITNPDISTSYSTTLVTQYGTSSVTYSFNCNRFLGDNTEYDTNISTLSSLLSALAYDGNYLSNVYTGENGHPLFDWFDYHAFSGFDSYDLNDDYSDQHVSEMFVGHRTFSTGSGSANLICVVIRGTNGTLEEWQSNFDVGSTADYSSVSGWSDMTNHMGFDITARRLNTKLNAYISANNLSGGNNIYWITGHSRGGALANILAAIRVNAGNKVFAYTFASPATTTASTANVSASYDCIFNIINEDDLVPQLPLDSWGFKRYGTDISASIEDDGYADDWDALVGNELTYTSNKTSMLSTVSAFDGIADNRNQCYEYRTGINAYYVDSLYTTYESAQIAVNGVVAEYPSNTAGTYYWVPTGSAQYYGYAMYQKPAFLMQLIAAYMGNQIDRTSFLTTRVATYLGSAKEKLTSLAGLNLSLNNNIQHPHYVESYYLLATKLESD